jgi:hypothetical protein
MKKLKLEELQVESFHTSATGGSRLGTVRGHSGDPIDTIDVVVCWPTGLDCTLDTVDQCANSMGCTRGQYLATDLDGPCATPPPPPLWSGYCSMCA